jgi:peptidoglycan/xylan/chitin deacetylase (PgdA/CDA1 family)
MYHRVVPDDKAGQVLNHLLVTPTNFETQMKLLATNGWTTITLGTLAQDMQDGVKLPSKTFVLTFDDGWYDGYVYAWPIMQKYGFVGTFFVISSRIGSSSTISPLQMLDLEANGNEIGDHSVTHYDLAGHAYNVDFNQICMAADTIATFLGHRPVSFAYPMGGYDNNTSKALAACPGMKIAVTENDGATESWKTRLLTERVRVNRGAVPAGVLSYMQALTK